MKTSVVLLKDVVYLRAVPVMVLLWWSVWQKLWGWFLVQRSFLRSFLKFRETGHPGLPRTISFYACCHGVITRGNCFHTPNFPNLYSKLYEPPTTSTPGKILFHQISFHIWSTEVKEPANAYYRVLLIANIKHTLLTTNGILLLMGYN